MAADQRRARGSHRDHHRRHRGAGAGDP